MTDTDDLIERLREFNCSMQLSECLALRREAAKALVALARERESLLATIAKLAATAEAAEAALAEARGDDG